MELMKVGSPNTVVPMFLNYPYRQPDASTKEFQEPYGASDLMSFSTIEVSVVMCRYAMHERTADYLQWRPFLYMALRQRQHPWLRRQQQRCSGSVLPRSHWRQRASLFSLT
jgi:hypothetical protein